MVLAWAGLLLLVLYSPLGSPEMYNHSNYNKNNYSVATIESNEYRLKKKDKVFVKAFTKAVSTEAKMLVNENLSGHYLEAVREENEFEKVFDEYLLRIIEEGI